MTAPRRPLSIGNVATAGFTAAATLVLGYGVGALIGALCGDVALWKAIGSVIGILSLVCWHFQPEPGLVWRILSIRHWAARRQVFLRFYMHPIEYLYLLFSWVLVLYGIGWIASSLWLVLI